MHALARRRSPELALAVCVNTTATRRDELIRALPKGWAWHPIAESRVAFAGVVCRD